MPRCRRRDQPSRRARCGSRSRGVLIAGQPFDDQRSGLRPLEPGTDVLLLLERSEGRLVPAFTFHSAFALEAAGVRPLVANPRFAPSYRGASAEAVIDDVLGA